MVENNNFFLGADSIAVTSSLQSHHPPHPHPAGLAGGQGAGEGGEHLGLYPAHPSEHQTPGAQIC